MRNLNYYFQYCYTMKPISTSIVLLQLITTIAFAFPFTSCNQQTCESEISHFITADSVNILREGKPYYFVGTNLWYAPLLGAENGNRVRLQQELDCLKEMGIENLRILVGADAGSCHANSVQPYLQSQPGVLNDTLLVGLDYTLTELAKRNMTAVIYLTNSWDWSGGYGFYLRECGFGDSPNANGEGYNDYVKYAANFVRSQEALELFYKHAETIVSRVNSITDIAYKDDPTIFAWQICNEPRPFSKDNKELFAHFIAETAKRIKTIDPNHMVSLGSEGLYGCESDEELLVKVHTDPNIDYLTLHIWPVNWGWASRENPDENIENACKRTNEYIDFHYRIWNRIKKPMVIEEFGFPREGNSCDLQRNTLSRDSLYKAVFHRVMESHLAQGPLAGCNFWGWGGSGRPRTETWSKGDDFLCDPPHEPQGWYSVFDSDSTTIKIIKHATNRLTSSSSSF